MPLERGYDVWIEVDGCRLPEYNLEIIQGGHTRIVTSWIASETGKEFTVRWKAVGALEPGQGDLFVDGHFVTSKTLSRNGSQTQMDGVQVTSEDATRSGWKRTIVAPFIFEDVSYPDVLELGAVGGPNAARHTSLGAIELVVWSMKLDTGLNLRTPPIPDVDHLAFARLNLQHYVSFGTPVTRYQHPNSSFWTTSEPAFRFVFQYRPKHVLQAMNMIPDIRQALQPEGQRRLGSNASAASRGETSTRGMSSRSDQPRTCGRDVESENDQTSEPSASAVMAELAKLRAEMASMKELLQTLLRSASRPGEKECRKRKRARSEEDLKGDEDAEEEDEVKFELSVHDTYGESPQR